MPSSLRSKTQPSPLGRSSVSTAFMGVRNWARMQASSLTSGFRGVVGTAMRSVLLAFALLLALAAPAPAAIIINEVESQEGIPGDWIELHNTGGAPVDISGYVLKDSNPGNSFTVPAATSIAANGYYVAD